MLFVEASQRLNKRREELLEQLRRNLYEPHLSTTLYYTREMFVLLQQDLIELEKGVTAREVRLESVK